MAYFPVNINIENKKCFVIGGGTVAKRKVNMLLDFGADVTVVAEELKQDKDADCLKETYALYQKAAKNYFYDEEKQLFISGECRQISYASQVWLILGGVVDAKEGLQSWRRNCSGVCRSMRTITIRLTTNIRMIGTTVVFTNASGFQIVS